MVKIYLKQSGTWADLNDSYVSSLNGSAGDIIIDHNTVGAYSTAEADALFATITYVDNQISNLIASAPTALDTLNELAAALGDDPNFATTITSTIGTKISKSGDTVSGTLDFDFNGDVISFNGKPAIVRHTTIGGMSIGADDAVVIGAGESRSQVVANESMVTERLHFSAEDGIRIHLPTDNWGSGWSARKVIDINTSGIFIDGNEYFHEGNMGSGSGLNAERLEGQYRSSSSVINTVVSRDGAADVYARLFRSDFPTTAGIPPSTVDIGYRVDDGPDSALRFMTRTNFIDWLGTVNNSNLLGGAAADASSSASTIVKRTSGQVVFSRLFNMTETSTTGTFPSNIFIETGTDGYIRRQTVANFKNNLDLNSSTSNSANTLVKRDSNGIVTVGSVETEISTQTSDVLSTAQLAFRNNNTTDNRLRFAGKGTISDFLGDPGATANSIVRRTNDGDILANHFVTAGSVNASTMPSQVYVEIGNNNIIRSQSIADFKTNLGLDSGVTTPSPNTLVERDSAADIHVNTVVINASDITAAPSHVMVETNSNGYVRPQTLATFKNNFGKANDSALLNNKVNSTAATGSTIVERNTTGHINATFFNTTAAFTAGTPTAVYVEINGDGYIRKQTLGNLKNALGISSDATTLGGLPLSSTTHNDEPNRVVRTGGGGAIHSGRILAEYEPSAVSPTMYNDSVIAIEVPNGSTRNPSLSFHTPGVRAVTLYQDFDDLYIQASAGANGKVWHSGNDGSGSGLDADTIDGVQLSNIAQLDEQNVFTANQRITQDLTIGGGAAFNSWLTLHGGDQSNERTGISIGESGKWGGASLHIYYTGDGYSHIGMGTMDASSHAANRHMTMYYQTNTVTFPGIIDGQSTIRENGQSLSSRYLGLTAKASDSNLLDGINSNQFLRSDIADSLEATVTINAGDLIFNNRDRSPTGVYNSSLTQQIWSMGAAYKNSASGADFGNLYGAAYKYSTSLYAKGHQFVWCQNGNATSALGSDIWTSGTVEGNTGEFISVIENGTSLSAKYLGISGTAANSSLLSGYAANQSQSNNTVVVRDSNGNIDARTIHLDSTLIDELTPSYVLVETGSNDGIVKRQPVADFISNLNLSSGGGGDADTLDGLDSTAFLRPSVGATISASYTFTNPSNRIQSVYIGSSFANSVYISNSGNGLISNLAGDLVIQNSANGELITIRSDDTGGTSRNNIVCNPDGATTLYYAGVNKFRTDANGTYTDGDSYITGNWYSSYSDERLKDVIDYLDPMQALNNVLTWRTVKYKANDIAADNGEHNTQPQIGLMVQDVEKDYPELTALAAFDRDDNGESKSGEEYKTLMYDRTVTVHTAAIQGLHSQIEDMASMMAQMRQQMEDMQSEIARLKGV